jgi:hypothetical protein
MDVSPHVHGKVTFRSHPLARLSQGNHEVDRPGPRPVWDQADLLIAHVPWRSEAQFIAKVRQGKKSYDATDLPEAFGHHWRRLGDNRPETLADLWSAMLSGGDASAMSWHPKGTLTEVDISRWVTWDPDRVLPDISSGPTFKA